MGREMARTLVELDRTGCRPIVVASHPRSGTHLCIDMLRLNFDACASKKQWFEPADRLYLDLDLLSRRPAWRSPELVRKILSRVPRPLIKTHAHPDFSRVLGDGGGGEYDSDLTRWLKERAKWVYAYRDGREAICSWQQVLMGRNPAADVPASEFIRQRPHGVSRVRAWAEHVESWRAQDRAYCIRMEQLRNGGPEVLADLAAALDLKWDRRSLRRPPKTTAAFLPRLKRRIVPRPASTAICPAPAHDRPIRWREAFVRSDRDFFRRENGGLLIRLGYERSPAWVYQTAPAPSTHASFPVSLEDSFCEAPAL